MDDIHELRIASTTYASSFPDKSAAATGIGGVFAAVTVSIEILPHSTKLIDPLLSGPLADVVVQIAPSRRLNCLVLFLDMIFDGRPLLNLFNLACLHIEHGQSGDQFLPGVTGDACEAAIVVAALSKL